jgi:DNA-binding NtrC family response regulator
MLSGYLSRASGQEFLVLEDQCVSLGDASCRMQARPRTEWGDEHAAALEAYNPAPLKEGLDESLQRVAETLKEAERRLYDRRRALKALAHEHAEPTGIVARSASMRRVIDLARRVAKVDATVLITGQSGAGKERIARLVHDESARARGPFIAINCGAIAETLLESELFGHSRGSFTGANQDRPGLFEAANGGTLLLDEVGVVPAAMQVKLLRVLQEREVRRVGENRSRPIDVRLLAATNRDLAHGVAGGGFRQDLYYRLKVVELHVPPLRERREDVLPLANVLLLDAATRMKRSLAGLSPSAAERLLQYDWPGNVRELENAMARAVALAQGDRIEEEDLPDELMSRAQPAVPTSGLVRPLEDVERDYILSALEQNGGNQTQTAVQLKIGSATLYRKLKIYGRLSSSKAEPLS